MTDDEIRAAYAALCAKIAKDKYPAITTKQAEAIGERTASRVTIWSETILANTTQADWLVDAEIGVDRSLVRPLPPPDVVQTHLEAKWLADHQANYIPPDVKINIAREIASADADKLLAMVPLEAVKEIEARPTTEVQKLEARAPQTDKRKDDAWIKETFGVEAAQLRPSQRRAYLAEKQKNENPQALQRDAYALDQLAGRDPAKLTAQERMTHHRATQALEAHKKRSA